MTEPRTCHCLLAFLLSRFLSCFCLRVEFCSNPEKLWVERAQVKKFLYFSLILWIYNNFKVPNASKVSYEATVFLNFLFCISVLMGLPGGSVVKNLQCRRPRFDPWVGKMPWRRAWQPASVLFPGESHGQRSLAGYSRQGRTESDTTKATKISSMAD